MTAAQWVSHKIQAVGLPVTEVIEPTDYEEGVVTVTPDLHVQVPSNEELYCSLVKIDVHGIPEYMAPSPIDQIIEELKSEIPTV